MKKGILLCKASKKNAALGEICDLVLPHHMPSIPLMSRLSINTTASLSRPHVHDATGKFTEKCKKLPSTCPGEAINSCPFQACLKTFSCLLPASPMRPFLPCSYLRQGFYRALALSGLFFRHSQKGVKNGGTGTGNTAGKTAKVFFFSLASPGETAILNENVLIVAPAYHF